MRAAINTAHLIRRRFASERLQMKTALKSVLPEQILAGLRAASAEVLWLCAAAQNR